jgi:TRAP-type mannitol/chloroaromatic compound transport system permease large subunit
MSRNKKLFAVLLAFFVGLIVVIGVVIGVVFLGINSFTSAAAETATGQLETIQSDNVDKAYQDFTTEQFKQDTSLLQFQALVRAYPLLKDYESVNFSEKSYQNVNGEEIVKLEGSLEGQEDTLYILYDMKKEGDTWKVQYMYVSSSPIEESN